VAAQPSPTGPAPRPSSGLALRIGAVITGLLIILGALNLFQLTVGRDSSRSHYAFASAPAVLSIESDSADVTLVSGRAGEISIDRKASTAHGRSVDVPRLSGSELSLPGDCHGGAIGWLTFCSVSYVVHVPAGLAVAVHTGSGDVGAQSVQASTLSLRTGSGDVSLRDVQVPTLLASTGSGDAEASGVRSDDVTIKTGSGDVDASFAESPQSLRATTGSGDLDLVLPRDGQPYDVRGRTGSGDYSNHVDTSESAGRTIDAQTGSGDLTIGYAG
jgi:hypothetical protein